MRQLGERLDHCVGDFGSSTCSLPSGVTMPLPPLAIRKLEERVVAVVAGRGDRVAEDVDVAHPLGAQLLLHVLKKSQKGSHVFGMSETL